MTGPMPEVGVKFTANGLDGVRRGLKLVKDEAEPTGRQWGLASRQIAGGLEQVARQGKVTGESLKAIISHGAEMAFMFGAGGPIVAAIGILSVAIFEGITNRMKEARDEARKFQEQIAGFRESGNLMGAGTLAQKLYSGDRFAVQRDGESDQEYEARALGVQGLRTKVEIIKNRPNFGLWGDQNRADDLKTYTALLAQYEERAKQAAAAVRELAAAEGQRILAGYNASLDNSVQLPGVSVGSPVPGAPSMMRNNNPMAYLPVGKLPGIGKATPADSPATQAMVEGMKTVGELAGEGFVDVLADTIEAGISRVFQKGANFGTVFAAIGETALAGLGSISVSIGRAALKHFAFIDKIGAAIAKWNPALGVAAALGLIALGSALGGAGHRIGANAGGGGGGGYGSYGSSNGYGSAIIDRGIIDPTRGAGVSARSGNNYSFTIIGANDPNAQKDILKLIRNAETRGTF